MDNLKTRGKVREEGWRNAEKSVRRDDSGVESRCDVVDERPAAVNALKQFEMRVRGVYDGLDVTG